MRFIRMLANKGQLDGVRVLSSNTVEWMSSNHLPGGVDMPSYAAMERADVGIAVQGHELRRMLERRGLGLRRDNQRLRLLGSVKEVIFC